MTPSSANKRINTYRYRDTYGFLARRPTMDAAARQTTTLRDASDEPPPPLTKLPILAKPPPQQQQQRVDGNDGRHQQEAAYRYSFSTSKYSIMSQPVPVQDRILVVAADDASSKRSHHGGESSCSSPETTKRNKRPWHEMTTTGTTDYSSNDLDPPLPPPPPSLLQTATKLLPGFDAVGVGDRPDEPIWTRRDLAALVQQFHAPHGSTRKDVAQVSTTPVANSNSILLRCAQGRPDELRLFLATLEQFLSKRIALRQQQQLMMAHDATTHDSTTIAPAAAAIAKSDYDMVTTATPHNTSHAMSAKSIAAQAATMAPMERSWNADQTSVATDLGGARMGVKRDDWTAAAAAAASSNTSILETSHRSSSPSARKTGEACIMSPDTSATGMFCCDDVDMKDNIGSVGENVLVMPGHYTESPALPAGRFSACMFHDLVQTPENIEWGGAGSPVSARHDGAMSIDKSAERPDTDKGPSDAINAVAMYSLADVSKLLDLLQLFQKAPFAELFDALKHGAAAKLSSDDLDWIRDQPCEAAHLGEASVNNLTSLALLSQNRNRAMKDELLKMFSNAGRAVKEANSLEQGNGFEFKVDRLTNIAVDVTALCHPMQLTVSWTTTSAPHSGSIQSLAVSLPSGVVINDEGKTVEVVLNGKTQVSLCSRSPDEKAIVLGTFDIAASDTGATALSSHWGDANGIELDIILTPGSCLQPGAKARIQVRPLLVSREVVANRHKEAQLHIEQAIELIKLLNESMTSDSGLAATADIQVAGESLLHAAVRLEDVALIKRLIILGADPNRCCETSGTPLELTRELTAKRSAIPGHDSESHADERSVGLQPHVNLPTNPTNFTSLVLPDINFDWVAERLEDICRYYGTKNGCLRIRSCHYVHIHMPWGLPRLKDLWMRCGRDSASFADTCARMEGKVKYTTGEDSHGRLWYTAKYSNVKPGKAWEQDVVFAEGDDGVSNGQGVYWYTSEDRALRALQKTVHVTFYAILNDCRPDQSIPGPHQLLFNRKPLNDCHRPGSQAKSTTAVVQRSSHRTSCAPEVPQQRIVGLYVRIQGFPGTADKEDIDLFFSKKNIDCGQIAMVNNKDGQFSGVINCCFPSEEEVIKAQAIDWCYFNSWRYLRVLQGGQDYFERALECERRRAL